MEFVYLQLFISVVLGIPSRLNLEILEEINGLTYPLPEVLNRQVVTNLTLVCRLSVTVDYNVELSWGKTPKNYTNNNKKDLVQYIKNRKPIQAFHPLLPQDAGIYFCASLQYNLFTFVKLQVVINPQYSCADGKFMCKSKACIDYALVCDNVIDCADGSDENIDLCGNDCCLDKHKCLNGQCISDVLCENNFYECCFHNDYDWIYMHNFDFSDNFNNDRSWHTGKNSTTTFKVIWILLPCVIILFIIICCIALRFYFVKTNDYRSTLSPTADVPPTYNVAVTSILPSAPLCEKI